MSPSQMESSPPRLAAPAAAGRSAGQGLEQADSRFDVGQPVEGGAGGNGGLLVPLVGQEILGGGPQCPGRHPRLRYRQAEAEGFGPLGVADLARGESWD